MLCYVVNQEQPGQVPVQSAGFASMDPITMQIFLSALGDGMKWVFSQAFLGGGGEEGEEGVNDEEGEDEAAAEKRRRGGARIQVKRRSSGGELREDEESWSLMSSASSSAGVEVNGGVLGQRWAGIMQDAQKDSRFF